MNTNDKHAELQEDGRPEKTESTFVTVTRKSQKERMNLLRDMAVKIQSYMCGFNKSQIGYQEGKKLLDRYEEIKLLEDLKHGKSS